MRLSAPWPWADLADTYRPGHDVKLATFPQLIYEIGVYFFVRFVNIDTGDKRKEDSNIETDFIPNETCAEPGCSEIAQVHRYCGRHFGLIAAYRVNRVIKELQETMRAIRLFRSLIASGQLMLNP